MPQSNSPAFASRFVGEATALPGTKSGRGQNKQIERRDKMNAKGRIGNKPIEVYESLDPKWRKFSASVPGIQNIQWFDTREQAEKFITSHGFAVFVKVPTIRITKAEHAALTAVAEAAQNLLDAVTGGMGETVIIKNEDEAIEKLNDVLSDLAAVRNGKVVQS